MDKIKEKIIIGITGASGAIYGIRLLEILRELEVETHLVISKAAHITITQETEYPIASVQALASFHYSPADISARISSGSFKTTGMIVAPCSMKTLAAIAHGFDNNLLSRAANVVLKERRKLVLMVRETPFHSGHLENMLKLSNYGAIIAPPLPAFYQGPKTIDDLVNHSVGRVLDLFGLDSPHLKRWDGLGG